MHILPRPSPRPRRPGGRRPSPSTPTSRSRSSSPSPPAARPTRSRATSPRRCASPSAGSPSSSRTSAARAARSAPPRSPVRANDGYTLLLHHIGMSTAPSLYRTLPYKTLERLRVRRHGQRSADDVDRQIDAAGEQLRRAAQVDGREQGQDQPRQRRPGRGLAPVRPAPAEHASRSTCRRFPTRARRRR